MVGNCKECGRFDELVPLGLCNNCADAMASKPAVLIAGLPIEDRGATFRELIGDDEREDAPTHTPGEEQQAEPQERITEALKILRRIGVTPFATASRELEDVPGAKKAQRLIDDACKVVDDAIELLAALTGDNP